jgi:hypothetical protein
MPLFPPTASAPDPCAGRRFAETRPAQDPSSLFGSTLLGATGTADRARGVREFVVGTGGGILRTFENPPLPTTAIRNDSTWGVLLLTLLADKYAWKFLAVTGGGFTDSGVGACH